MPFASREKYEQLRKLLILQSYSKKKVEEKHLKGANLLITKGLFCLVSVTS